ncbi:hypothetical protein G9P44_005205 [Scheffersomyces stipitis]|nr:hypothetical protein G9P44_005205 [Scheffersomyces stipitis]
MDNFYNVSSSLSDIRKELRKDTLSLKNRLQSILYDSKFVSGLELNFPLVPNERCGLWYVPNDSQIDSSYFKSTDGHTSEWAFSMRRLNLHLVPIIGEYDGISIIDSTRKGKLMPDALSKTIPIWCAVLNSILYEDTSDNEIVQELGSLLSGWSEDDTGFILDLKNNHSWLRTPKEMVFRSEHNLIVKRIPEFVKEVKHLGLISKKQLIAALGGKRKPLVPFWTYPGNKGRIHTISNDHNDGGIVFEDSTVNRTNPYYTIQCVTASKKTEELDGAPITVQSRWQDQELISTSWRYIQGAADDHELWATKDICQGNLSPKIFWSLLLIKSAEGIIDENTGYIYDWLSEAELTQKLNKLYSQLLESKENHSFVLRTQVSDVKNTKNDTGIILGIMESNIHYEQLIVEFPEVAEVVIFSDKYVVTDVPEKVQIQLFQHKIESSKKGSKQLREVLPTLVPKLKAGDVNSKILVLCDSGKDISAGLVVLLLCKYFDLEWKIKQSPEAVKVDKDLVKKQLSLLANVRKVNPSRNTLQSINTYLM